MRAVLLLLAFALAACGGRAPPPRPGEIAPLWFFLSPHGEPFRLTQGGQSPIAPWFAGADRDRDGRMTQAEFAADGDRFFSRVDANEDGFATSPEISSLRTREAPLLETWAGMAGEPVRPPEQEQPLWSAQHQGPVRRHSAEELAAPPIVVANLLREREPVLAADADFNRRVSRAEFTALIGARFEALDIDRDGALTMAELEAVLARRR